MSEIVVPAGADNFLVAIRIKDAIEGFVEDMLSGEARPDEEPHFVDVREWTRENWRQNLIAVPLIGWREHGQGGMLPLVAGPVTQQLKTLYPYSKPEERHGVFTQPFIRMGASGYWDGTGRLYLEREVLPIWGKQLLQVMLELYNSGQPLVPEGRAKKPCAPAAPEEADDQPRQKADGDDAAVNEARSESAREPAETSASL